MAAAGILVALVLAQRTARTAGVPPAHVWNACVIALITALLGSRLLLVAVNWRDLMRHPMWMFGLATIHSPWLAGAGAFLGGLAALAYVRWRHLPIMATLDALAAPLTVGLALEQIGALLAGAGYGTETSVPWAVVYSHPLSQRWSGTPLGVPLHPVQSYAALAYITLAILLLVGMPVRRQPGDVAGAALMGIGVSLYITEFWRDPEGRGQVLGGALDGPQVAAIMLVVAGGMALLQRRQRALSRDIPPSRQEQVAELGHGTFVESKAERTGAKDEPAHD
jgi:phosphatidylglycerol:prolipoprotein diacylglycerol transferase